MPPSEEIVFKCLEISQPIGLFYVGSISSEDLVAISYADVRRIKERDVEVLSGIQRPLSLSRVRELKDYVRTVDASFPTSIILTIKGADATYDAKGGAMRIRRDRAVAKIIDGQHRIAGLGEYSGPAFQLNATIFVDMEIEDQALMFATINLKQTRVSKSLAYDLYEFASGRSPQKTCHNIAKLLNHHEGSPMRDMIKILGVATGGPLETLTQATFVDRLLPYISVDAMKDRDTLKRGRKLRKVEASVEGQLIFRNMFIDEQDAEIAKVLWNYFKAVAARWPLAWQVKSPGRILNRTTGFGALMRFLGDVYRWSGKVGQVISEEECEKVFRKILLREEDFTSERYKPGTSGEVALYKELREFVG